MDALTPNDLAKLDTVLEECLRPIKAAIVQLAQSNQELATTVSELHATVTELSGVVKELACAIRGMTHCPTPAHRG